MVMEQMPASPSDAVTLSRACVDQADFYLGVFAFRYGTVPSPAVVACKHIREGL